MKFTIVKTLTESPRTTVEWWGVPIRATVEEAREDWEKQHEWLQETGRIMSLDQRRNTLAVNPMAMMTPLSLMRGDTVILPFGRGLQILKEEAAEIERPASETQGRPIPMCIRKDMTELRTLRWVPDTGEILTRRTQNTLGPFVMPRRRQNSNGTMRLLEALLLGGEMTEDQTPGGTLVGIAVNPAPHTCTAITERLHLQIGEQIKDRDENGTVRVDAEGNDLILPIPGNAVGDYLEVTLQVMQITTWDVPDYGLTFLNVTVDTKEDPMTFGQWDLARVESLWNPILRNKYSLVRQLHVDFWTYSMDQTLESHINGIRAYHRDRELEVQNMIYEMLTTRFVNLRVSTNDESTARTTRSPSRDTSSPERDGANGEDPSPPRRTIGVPAGMGPGRSTIGTKRRRGG